MQKRYSSFLQFIFLFAISTICAQQNISFRSNLKYPGQTCANIWGYVDSLGNEYALVGASLGLSIVNVSNPDSVFQVIQIPGPNNLWKEVRTWNKYAYVVSEGGGGLQIIDLSKLPDTTGMKSKYWQPVYNNITLVKAHTLHIDNGFAYLYGGTFSGALICDLSDPWNPVVAGLFSQTYIHDGYVRNNVLYGAHIYEGYFSIIDVSNKSTPNLLQTENSPKGATHNTWLSDNSSTLFVTDETTGSYLAAYDVSNISNITEIDQVQSIPAGSGSIVHNCHVKNDWVVCSYYRDGVVIFDGHRPSNLVQVANYDTYPAGSGAGYNGTWGVYPFLPSGILIASNIEDGLFVLSPTYKRACYLEGTVTDSTTGLPINTATISIQTTTVIDSTAITGKYAIGTVDTGNYTIQIAKPGYVTRLIGGVALTAGNVAVLNVKLKPVAASLNEVSRAKILEAYPNPFSNTFTVAYSFERDLNIDAQLLLTDVAGRIVAVKKIKNKSGIISIDDCLEKGIYFVQIQNGNSTVGFIKILKME
ncbi:MAG: choice-of-anchor B family protein [Bacteroidia bacterium]|nr:choice-of-anchor B family protein [Bacteroidia bacterium]